MKNVLYFPRKLNNVYSEYLYSRFSHLLSIMIAGAAAYLTYLTTDIYNYKLLWLDRFGTTFLLISLLLSLLIIVATYLFLQGKQIKKLKGTLKSKDGELRAYKDQLIQKCKLAEIGQLTSQIAHELNQDLTAISLSTSMISEIIKDRDIERIDFVNRMTLKNIERAINISKEINNFSRDTKGDSYKFYSINNLINGSNILFGTKLKNLDIDFRIALSDELNYIYCNNTQIEQLIINLLNNALDALDGKKGKIILRTYQKDSNVVIEVEDNGTGIDELELNNICKAFYTTKEPGKGTGLGLFICNEIISRHSGKLEILSKKGDGSTFRVFLPSYKEAA